MRVGGVVVVRVRMVSPRGDIICIFRIRIQWCVVLQQRYLYPSIRIEAFYTCSYCQTFLFLFSFVPFFLSHCLLLSSCLLFFLSSLLVSSSCLLFLSPLFIFCLLCCPRISRNVPKISLAFHPLLSPPLTL